MTNIEPKQLSFNDHVNSINDWLIGMLVTAESLIGSLPENPKDEEASSTRCGEVEDGLIAANRRSEKLHTQLQRIVDRIG